MKKLTKGEKRANKKREDAFMAALDPEKKDYSNSFFSNCGKTQRSPCKKRKSTTRSKVWITPWTPGQMPWKEFHKQAMEPALIFRKDSYSWDSGWRDGSVLTPIENGPWYVASYEEMFQWTKKNKKILLLLARRKAAKIKRSFINSNYM